MPQSLLISLPTPISASWNDMMGCLFPKLFLPRLGLRMGALGFCLSSSSHDRLSLRRSSLYDSLPSLHSVFLSGGCYDIRFIWLKKKKNAYQLISLPRHSENPLRFTRASLPGSKPGKAPVTLLWPKPSWQKQNCNGHKTFLCSSNSSMFMSHFWSPFPAFPSALQQAENIWSTNFTRFFRDSTFVKREGRCLIWKCDLVTAGPQVSLRGCLTQRCF